MRHIADEFVAAWNDADADRLEQLFHPDFRWHIAVTDHDDPNMRSLQSELLDGMNLPWQQSIYDKAETLEVFRGIFAATDQFQLELKSVIADGDRAAIEAVGDAINPLNGRRYQNLYCYVFERRDDQLVLFREYQDTLHLFDVWVAE
ncbi:nuclear transport factor 2 family protein [Ilumatobacter nonamiensis]|uniref:nuclear transport factor 2 family protein n=1 Tax=Ilumatobacter nonamiensis TaxID=467093 RepID=UPI0011D22BEF|nr:nuclear transport factor 2 family protein [Ilumatobacter nonamiensis]